MRRMDKQTTMGALQASSLEIRLKNLRQQFEKAWSRDTCWHKPEFNSKVPSAGQCFVTSMIVQDIFGGKLIQGTVKELDGCMSHYWNKLPNGKEYDLTSDQFMEGDGIHRHSSAIQLNRFVNPNRRCVRYLLLKKRLSEAKDLNMMS